MNEKLRKLELDDLFKAILTLKTTEECYKFFDDLCTTAELRAMSQRMRVAKMLTDQKVYSEIVAKTGVSTAIISRVNRSLQTGGEGYEIVFERLYK